MDPNKTQDRIDLMATVEADRLKLDEIRENRRKLLKRTSGSEWYPDGADSDTPINQMSQAETVLVQRLAGGEPQALVVPSHPDLDVTAYEQTQALNKLSQQLSLRKKLRRLIRDAIYGIGICRLGMTLNRWVPLREIAPELDEEGTAEIGIGRMILEVISLENWVHDISADTLEEVRYAGHSYWVCEDDIGHYLPGVSKEDLTTEEKKLIDEHGAETAGAISRGSEGNEDYEKHYWLWDLWMPYEQVVITVPVNGTGEIAHVRDWTSRPGGPYMFLYYQEVPDQAVPKSIMADLALVHDSLNSTFRKLINQTAEAKTVLGYKPGAEDDAQRIADAASRATIQMRDPNAVQEFNFNGPSAELLTMLLQTRDLASIIGGNTDALGGLGAQTPTATQEQIVQGQAGAKIESMEVETAEFVRELFEGIRWYLYHEQLEPVTFQKEVEGTDIRVPGEFSAWDAVESEGNFDSFALQIEPYSLVYRPPEQRLRTILELWERLIMPLVQTGMLQQIPDTEKLLEIVARYSHSPELRSILRQMSEEEMMMMAGGGGGEPRQSPVTTRNYVRHGAPGPTRRGEAAQMLQNMQGMQKQAGVA